MESDDIRFMRLALREAEAAARAGEVPIGALAVAGGQAVASAHNRVEEKKSAVAHAEIELLHALERLRGDWRMEDVTVYVTKEPCPMCAGALVNARVRRIVCGAADPRFGGCSVFGIPRHPGALWRPEVAAGVCAGESEALLSGFFREARVRNGRLPIRMRNDSDPEYEAMLNALMRRVFGFDFDFWFRRGFRDGNYESYSLSADGRMLAHAGVSRQKLRAAGKEFLAIQLGAVACAPEARGNGYARRLIDNILRRYSGTPAFLFANDSVLEFYPKFGFIPAETRLPVADAAVDNTLPARKAAPEEVYPLTAGRRPASALFDAPGGRSIRCFHLFGEFADKLYLPAPGIAVAAEQDGNILRLYELFSDRPVSWSTLAPLLPFRGIRRIEFGFCPARLGIDFRWEPPPEPERLFIRGDWNLPENFIIPLFART